MSPQEIQYAREILTSALKKIGIEPPAGMSLCELESLIFKHSAGGECPPGTYYCECGCCPEAVLLMKNTDSENAVDKIVNRLTAN